MYLFQIPIMVFLIISASLAFAENPNNLSMAPQSQGTEQKNRIQAIDQEIDRLELELESYIQKEITDVEEGQKYMIADWEKYSLEIQEARKDELKAIELKKKILILKQEKKFLTQQNN